jgi:hypothetical protein
LVGPARTRPALLFCPMERASLWKIFLLEHKKKTKKKTKQKKQKNDKAKNTFHYNRKLILARMFLFISVFNLIDTRERKNR